LPRLSHAQVILYFVDAEASDTRFGSMPWFGARANMVKVADLAAVDFLFRCAMGLGLRPAALNLLGELGRAEGCLSETHRGSARPVSRVHPGPRSLHGLNG